MTINPIGEPSYPADPPSLESWLVDEEYPPNQKELLEKLKTIDIVEQLKDGKLTEMWEEGLSISFPTLEHSRLFALKLLSNGAEEGLMVFNTQDILFEDERIGEFRFGGEGLSLTELRGEQNTIIFKLSLRNAGITDSTRKREFSKLTRETIEEAMPHLKEEIRDFEIQ